MFCDEPIRKVYIGVIEDDDVYSHNAFLDCYHDLAYHCTVGYRLVLETDHYAISLSYHGVSKENKENLCEADGEWLQNGIEILEEEEPPFVRFESTLFVGERLLTVTKGEGIFLAQFDDFLLKIVPHEKSEEIPGSGWLHGHYHRVMGCERHLTTPCPLCGGKGELLLDFVRDYFVRCQRCKRSTWSQLNAIDAIEEWNEGELNWDGSNIVIE